MIVSTPYVHQAMQQIINDNLPENTQFDMDVFGKKIGCGTVCCVIGLAHVLEHGELTEIFPGYKPTTIREAWLTDLFWKNGYTREEAIARYNEIMAMPDGPLAGADLTGIDLSWADLTGADLTGANLTEANLFATDLTGANLTNANLTNAHLLCTTLIAANLNGTNFTGTDLQYAEK